MAILTKAAPEVTAHINDQPYLSIKRILVPVKDKRKLREGQWEYAADRNGESDVAI